MKLPKIGFTLKNSRTDFSGFTLIELLVVMMIIGILAVIGMGNYMNSLARGRDATRKGNLRTVAQSLELYSADYEIYPQSNANGQIVVNSVPVLWGLGQFGDGKQVYLPLLPQDPNKTGYFYQSSATGKSYKIWARLEVSTDPDIVSSRTPGCSGFSSFPICGGGQACNYGVTSNNTTICSTSMP